LEKEILLVLLEMGWMMDWLWKQVILDYISLLRQKVFKEIFKQT